MPAWAAKVVTSIRHNAPVRGRRTIVGGNLRVDPRPTSHCCPAQPHPSIAAARPTWLGLVTSRAPPSECLSHDARVSSPTVMLSLSKHLSFEVRPSGRGERSYGYIGSGLALFECDQRAAIETARAMPSLSPSVRKTCSHSAASVHAESKFPSRHGMIAAP